MDTQNLVLGCVAVGAVMFLILAIRELGKIAQYIIDAFKQ